MSKGFTEAQHEVLRRKGLGETFAGDGRGRITPTPGLIGELLNARFTISEIARATGYTRQHISKVWKERQSPRRTPKEVAEENWPIPTTEFKDSYAEKRLRDHLHYTINRADVPEWKARVLTGLYRHMLDEGLIIEFDPEIGPTEFNGTGGYAYRVRRPEDGMLMIRENEHVQLTSEGRRVWRIPKRLPDGSER